MNQPNPNDALLINSVDEFKEYKELWDEDGNIREHYFPKEINLRPDEFKNAFTLGIVCTPWSRRKTQWDLKLHFKNCYGLTVMRKISEITRKWVAKHEPGKAYPERVCRVSCSQSPMIKNQMDFLLTGVPGEQIELCLETLVRTLKQYFG